MAYFFGGMIQPESITSKDYQPKIPIPIDVLDSYESMVVNDWELRADITNSIGLPEIIFKELLTRRTKEQYTILPCNFDILYRTRAPRQVKKDFLNRAVVVWSASMEDY